MIEDLQDFIQQPLLGFGLHVAVGCLGTDADSFVCSAPARKERKPGPIPLGNEDADKARKGGKPLL
ncbi:hypothetical protein ACFSHP_09920 [Novosphingobium panipatense]